MKKSLLKRSIGALLGICMAFSLAACSGGSSSTHSTGPTSTPAAGEEAGTPAPSGDGRSVSFALWDEEQYPVFQEICAQFTAETGIEVELQLTPWSQYWTKLDAAASAGNAADVFWMNIFLPKYAEAGIIENLEPYFEADGLDKSNWNESMLDLYSIDGDQWGMPKGMDVVVLAYNKAIFDKYDVAYPQEGWTWAEMEAIGIELRDKIAAEGGSEYPLVMELDSQPSYLQFVLQDGVTVYPGDGTSGYGTPEAQNAFNDILSLMDTQVMPSFTVLSDTKGTDLFISERSAMLYVGSWKSVVLDGCSIASDIGLVTMPSRSVNNVCGLGGLSYTMNANAADKDAAWQLISYLGGEESNRMQAEGRIDIPAYISAQQYYAPAFQNIDPTAFITQSATSTTYPTHDKMAGWQGIETDYTAAIFSGATPVADALAAYAAEVEAMMAE